MSSRRYQERFQFDGLVFAVASDDEALSHRLRERLGSLAGASSDGPSELQFDFLTLPASAAHPIEMPPAPHRAVYDHDVAEVIYAPESDTLYVSFEDRVRVHVEPRADRAVISLRADPPENVWLASHGLFTFPLVELLRRKGRYHLHAGGAASNGRAVLLPGTSGAGKSTLSLALARRGLSLLGDDKVFLRREPDSAQRVRILGFPEEVDVTDTTASFFPELSHLAGTKTRPGWPKHGVDASAFGTICTTECVPGLLVFPRVSGEPHSRLSPLDPQEALLQLLPNVLLTGSDVVRQHLDAISDLVRASRCYRLETGTNLDEAVDRVLEELDR